MEYRKLLPQEAERIAELDATHFIKNVWRKDTSGEYKLVQINWTDTELPNGFDWHLRHFRETLRNGGSAFGCFDSGKLIGYATLEGSVFGRQKYVLLDQLFVSNAYRSKGIGKRLFALCAEQARQMGARKLHLCAGSAENTIAFYYAIGCAPAAKPNQKLIDEDPNDIRLEFDLRREL